MGPYISWGGGIGEDSLLISMTSEGKKNMKTRF